jgi:hypothetical protein
VTRLSDTNIGHGGRGSLRYCLTLANHNAGPDTIDFKVQGTIQLTSPLPGLASDITILGPGADLLAVSGPGLYGFEGPLFVVLPGATVTLSGLTVTQGYNEGSAGGIFNYGTVLVEGCTVSNNYDYLGGPGGLGGGITNESTMTITGSTISGNQDANADSDVYGGGIYNGPSGVLHIDSSTVSGNYIDIGEGGGIYNDSGTLDVRFSTVTKNYAGGSTSLGLGISNGGPPMYLYDTIVAGNSGQDLEGSYTGSSDLIGGDPMLGPLADNGGHTQTHAVLPGSPALDAGDNTGAPQWDQRGPGFPRIVNGTIDIGAFEAQNTESPGTSAHLALDGALAQAPEPLSEEPMRNQAAEVQPRSAERVPVGADVLGGTDPGADPVSGRHPAAGPSMPPRSGASPEDAFGDPFRSNESPEAPEIGRS